MKKIDSKAETEAGSMLSVDLLNDARIPVKFQSFLRSGYFGDEATYAVIRQYIQNKDEIFKNGIGLFIHGEHRSFKTFFATFILRHAMTKGYTALYVEYRTLVDIAFNRESGFNSFASSAQFMAVDDVPAEPKTAPALLRLIQFRTNEGLPTLVVTAETIEDLSNGIGHACYQYLVDYFKEVETFSPQAKMEQYFAKLKAPADVVIKGD